MAQDFDPIALRNALGHFVTGVTVITACGADGSPLGLTANSFNSVSLDPPLVLWSIAKTSENLEAYKKASAFAVNILCDAQTDVALRFAKPMTDRFTDLSWQKSPAGVPLIDGCLCNLECEPEVLHDSGDHILFIARVIGFTHRDAVPLVYFRGAFSELTSPAR